MTSKVTYIGRYKIKKPGRPPGYKKPIEQIIKETKSRLEHQAKVNGK